MNSNFNIGDTVYYYFSPKGYKWRNVPAKVLEVRQTTLLIEYEYEGEIKTSNVHKENVTAKKPLPIKQQTQKEQRAKYKRTMLGHA